MHVNMVTPSHPSSLRMPTLLPPPLVTGEFRQPNTAELDNQPRSVTLLTIPRRRQPHRIGRLALARRERFSGPKPLDTHPATSTLPTTDIQKMVSRFRPPGRLLPVFATSPPTPPSESVPLPRTHVGMRTNFLGLPLIGGPDRNTLTRPS